jgi:PAS domain S-box-containing protein
MSGIDRPIESTTSLHRTVNAGYGAAALLLLLIGGVSYWRVTAFLHAADERRHSYELRLRLIALQDDLSSLQQPGLDDSIRAQRLAALRPQVTAQLADLNEAITPLRERGLTTSLPMLGRDAGRAETDSLRTALAALSATETASTERSDARLLSAGRVARLAIVGGTVLALAVVVIAGFLFRRDVLARGRAEEELRRSQTFLDSVIEQIPHMIFIKDAADLRFVRFNRAGEELLGYSRFEMIGKNDFDFFPEAQAQFFVSKDREVLTGGTVVDIPMEEIHTRHKGTRILHTKKVPVLDPAGRPNFLLGVSEDITEQRHAADALRDAQSRLQQVLAFSPTVIYVLDVSGDGGGSKPIWVSENFTRMTGYDISSALDNAWTAEQLHPDERPRLLAEFPALLRQDQFTREYRFRFRDGSYHWIRDEARVLRDASGQPMQLLGAWLDISERVRAEEDLRRARAAAESANQTKSEFLAKMSHELRTPLNSIIGFSEMLDDQTFGPLNDKQLRYVDNVLSSGRQLLDLINDILDLSKVEAGRMELVPAPIDVATALDDARVRMESLAGQKGHTIGVEVEPQLPALSADAGKFRQIMDNLLSNAIKFTPNGGRIRMSARRAPAGDGIEVVVSDNGIGIKPEDQGRIFQEFEQLDNAYVREQQGTGLGLALTRKLVELHGGRIGVESQPGEGSTFRFVLPFEPRAPEPPVWSAVERVTGGLAEPLVLVVEDDLRAGDLLGHFLKEAGYRVAHAATGNQALALAKSLKPDAITLDILLPGEDGLAILGQLKGGVDTKNIPVVVVSITDHRELGFSLGAIEWLVKPVQRDAFVESVRKAVGTLPPGRTPTVLVVDDERATVELLTDTLTTQGFRALGAFDGREGITAAVTHRPDAIVLDLVMPGLTGFDVVRELRDHPAGRNIPILVFTAKELTAADRAHLKDSVQAIIPKEGPATALLNELSRVCPVGGKR